MLFLLFGYFFIAQVGVEFRTNSTFFSGNAKKSIFLQDQILYPSYEGFRLSKGLNIFNSVLFFFGAGDEKNGIKILAEPFVSFPRQESNLFLHRFSTHLQYGVLYLSGGKDNLTLGPGIHNSILLSHNLSPQNHAWGGIKNLKLPCLGNFCFGDVSALGGILFIDDVNYKYPDPNFLVMRFDWEIYFLRLGASRIIAFGGKGGVKPKTFRDYIDLFTARLENASGLCRDIQDEAERRKCEEYWLSRDTNQAAEFFGVVDFSKIIPSNVFEELFGYFEYAGDDIVACWQVEDVKIIKCLPIPFRLAVNGWVVGFGGKRENISFNAEYTWFNKSRAFYAHHNYPLAVKGSYTGAHTGPFSDDVWLKFSYSFFSDMIFGFRFHFFRRWKRDSDSSQVQEKVFEFGPQFAVDLDDSTTLGISLVLYYFQNPDLSSLPFSYQPKFGNFLDFSLSLFFSYRY